MSKSKKWTGPVAIGVVLLLIVSLCIGGMLWWNQDADVKFKVDKDRYWQLEHDIGQEVDKKQPGWRVRVNSHVEEQNEILMKWKTRFPEGLMTKQPYTNTDD